MEVNEYQDIIKKTAVYPKEMGVSYSTMGLAGEVGEICEKIKKLYRDNGLFGKSPKQLDNFEEIRMSVCKELGDSVWYITDIASHFDISLSEVLETNYEKLIKRRETNTLHGSGDNREE